MRAYLPLPCLPATCTCATCQTALNLTSVPAHLPCLPADYFPFLTDPSNLRNRTTFYHTLARLLFMEDTPAKFKSFVAPLQQVLAGLAAASSNATNAAALRASVPRETVIGLFRDLRGIATATNSRRTYGEFFYKMRRCRNAGGLFLLVCRCMQRCLHPHVSPVFPHLCFHCVLLLQACCSTGCTRRTSPPLSPAWRPGQVRDWDAKRGCRLGPVQRAARSQPSLHTIHKQAPPPCHTSSISRTCHGPPACHCRQLPLPATATACNCHCLQLPLPADTPEVTTALLKFMAEFVLNKTQRLTFDSSSPNGILLFREVSRVICTYGSRVVGAPPPGEPYGAVSWLPGWRSGLGLCV